MTCQDVVTFTGSASTGRMLKSHPKIINEAVPFNMEADSLNACILGEDVVPESIEFDLFVKEVQKASKNTGEKVWELPLWDDYSRDIKSKIADIKNLGNGRLAGTITAGAFLKEFVGDIPWCHFDIAGTTRATNRASSNRTADQ